MKKILVVDESRAVRETLGIILGREFRVVQSQLLPSDKLASPDLKPDLLIMGAPPGSEIQPSDLFKIAARSFCPVLLLLDSRSALVVREKQENVDCLAKPFNPYELREKVARLLAKPDIPSTGDLLSSAGRDNAIRYVDFPYLPFSTSVLAKRFVLTSLPILIVGETGCGQDRVARALYHLKELPGPWIAVYGPEITREYLYERVAELSRGSQNPPQRLTLYCGNVDALDLSAQCDLLDFLTAEEGRGRELWILSSSKEDLLEKVYRAGFLDALYYRLATLTLRLAPLRERQDDLAFLAAQVAQETGERLNLGKVTLSSDALERFRNYLWFGNFNELELVIARTLATHRKEVVEAADLVWAVPDEGLSFRAQAAEEKSVSGEKGEKKLSIVSATQATSSYPGSSNGDLPDMSVLINELAHELKNPMVTIKTFAQLLGERFDDDAFRVRFQETVSSDIERMDELLEAILDFSRLSLPSVEKVLLYPELRQVTEEILPECIKREATVRWLGKGETEEVMADESHMRYVFKNVFRTVLAEVRPKGEIQVEVEGRGKVAVTYVRERDRMSPITQYLEDSECQKEEEALPLRLLLAKILLRRNGGGMKVDHLDGGKVLIRTELPTHLSDSR